jgi:signal transduction histidine kinase
VVSHDLRSLLGGLSLNAGLIVIQAPEGAGGDDMRRHAATSQRIVARMSRLLNDLLDIVSMEAGNLALLPEQVEVGEIVRETVAAFEEIAAKKRIKIGIVAAPERLHARLDGGRVLQVLANLVSNALKFTPADGRVAIHVEGGEHEIRFSVSDTGVGIPESALPGVFDRFRQVARDRRGLGLGLHISKGIVEAHGGSMWVESTVGVGSTFHFALPMRHDSGEGRIPMGGEGTGDALGA